MKKITAFTLLTTLFVLFVNRAEAQDTTIKKTIFDSVKKKGDSLRMYADSIHKISNSSINKPADTKGYGPAETMNLVIVIAFFFIMALLLVMFFVHLNVNHQRIGYQSIKLIGLILIFPGVCILATVGQGILKSETLAALFGTIAGYVLSREDDNKDNINAAHKKTEEDLQAKIKLLEDTIKTIKEKNPNLVL